MKKLLLGTAVALCLNLPVYAGQFNNSDQYMNPFEEDTTTSTETTVVEKKTSTKLQEDKEKGEVLPVKLKADHAEYDSTSGEFVASGNVVVSQGVETIKTTHAHGNLKTGDLWLEQGGTIINPENTLNGAWAHYNFNTKTGEIKEITGHGVKDVYHAPHATITPDKLVVDQGGTMSRCPSVKHPPCLSITAATFEVYPKEKIVARDVKVFIRGKHIYSRDLWVNYLDGGKTKIMPRFGYKDSDNGAFVKLEVEQPIGEKTMVGVDLAEYSKVGFKPVYSVDHNERNFSVRYSTGWEEDDDIWYKKQNNWIVRYKPHHIVDGLPISYSGFFEYGLWKNDKTKVSSWHKEYAIYLNHDPIHLFNSQDTTLNLTMGKKWVNESVTNNTNSTDMYYATLSQKLSPKWNTWVGYYREKLTSSLFDINQPDMARELRNGITFKPDDKNSFTIINRYDLEKHNQYETDYRWRHTFCCWAIELTYEKEQLNKDSKFKFEYYFFNL